VVFWLGFWFWLGHLGAALGRFFASLAVVGAWGDHPPSGVVGDQPPFFGIIFRSHKAVSTPTEPATQAKRQYRLFASACLLADDALLHSITERLRASKGVDDATPGGIEKLSRSYGASV
jgi:hypothetical protein